MIRILALSAFLSVTGDLGAGVYRSASKGGLPFRLEQNRGQFAGSAAFIARGSNYRLEITPTEDRLVWANSSLTMRFIGANPNARMQPQERTGATANYFVGDSTDQWRTGVPNYAALRVNGIYPGMDLVFHGTEEKLEYDLVVTPGSDPRFIQLEFREAKRLRVTPEGDLLIFTKGGSVRWHKPVVYQPSGDGRTPVDGRFALAGRRRVGFRLGGYDRSRTLVIDPTLAYASYFGTRSFQGSGFESPRGIGVDGSGNVYIAGVTSSYNLPATAGSFQTAFAGLTANLRYVVGDAFVAKFTPQGALAYVTYLGGSGDDAAFGIAVDSAGNAYIAGMTNSTNFPTTAGVLQPKFKGSNGNPCTSFGDAFVAKLDPTGSTLLYSTYLGGSRDDFAGAIAVDSTGNAYVAGATLSTDFPTLNAFQSSFHGGGGEPGRPSCNGAPLFDGGDAFVAKLNPTATSLVFSTYLGGSQDDVATAIAVDSSGNSYVGGMTLSPDFPVTANVLRSSFGGSDPQNVFYHMGDGFIAKLSPSGAALGYATYLGGNGDDVVMALTVDKAGTVYATGSTSSTNFPVTANAMQSAYGGYVSLPFSVEQNVGDAFAVRLDPKGASLLYSTYLGGSSNDGGMAIAVDPSGLIYVAGMTDSQNFRVTSDAAQSAFAGDDSYGRLTYFPMGDGFLTIIDPNLKAPVYSTYFGGLYNDGFTGLALDPNGNVWLAGFTKSPDLKVTSNAAIAKYGGGPVTTESPDPTTPVVGQAMVVQFSTTGAAGGPTLAAVANAASGKGGVVSAGMVFAGYGSNLGPANLIGAAFDSVSGLLSNSISGTSVLFDNIPAPMLFAEGTVVSGIVPYEVAGRSSTQVVVEVEGKRSAPLTVQVQPTAPGLFSANLTGTGPAIAFSYPNGQGTVNSTSNPVPIGGLLSIFLTGEGQTLPAGQDGLASGLVAPSPVAPVSVNIGGVPQTNLQYVGEIPAEVPGVLQVNLYVANGTPSGTQPILVQIGGVSSQPGMTIVIQ